MRCFPFSNQVSEGIIPQRLLVRLLSDFYGAMDRGQVTLLALFVVSAAFDSVDHSILLQRLYFLWVGRCSLRMALLLSV